MSKFREYFEMSLNEAVGKITSKQIKQIEQILGYKVIEVKNPNKDLIENSGEYNKTMTLCIEDLINTNIKYITMRKNTKDDSEWYSIGYIKELDK